MRESFIVNVADAPAYRHPAAGAVVMFEQLNQPFPEVGINIRILQAGESREMRWRSRRRLLVTRIRSG